MDRRPNRQLTWRDRANTGLNAVVLVAGLAGCRPDMAFTPVNSDQVTATSVSKTPQPAPR